MEINSFKFLCPPEPHQASNVDLLSSGMSTIPYGFSGRTWAAGDWLHLRGLVPLVKVSHTMTKDKNYK